MVLGESKVKDDPNFIADINGHSKRINTVNYYDFEADFGAATDGVTGCSDALQSFFDTIAATPNLAAKLRTRSRTYVLDKQVVFPTVPLTSATPTFEIEGPHAFSVVSFAPGFPMTWDVPPIGTGTIFKSTVTPLLAPVQAAASTATTGGALAAATYFYKITATFKTLETVWSNERSITTTGSTSTVTLNWAVVTGATGYKVYRGTATNTENVLVATVSGGSTVSYTDLGGATTAATPPGLTNAGTAVFGSPYVVNNLLFSMKNAIVRLPMDPTTHGIDGAWITNMRLENVKIDTGGSTGDVINPILVPTHGTIGVQMPGVGNGGHVRGEDVSVEGFAVGLTHSEHCLLDNYTAFKNLVGMQVNKGYHAACHGRISLYWNKVGLQTSGPTASPVTRLSIAELDYEETDDPNAWFYTTAHVDDPQNQLRGQMDYHRVISAQGIVAWLKRNGAAYADISYLGGFDRTIFDAIGFEGTASATTTSTSLATIPPQAFLGTWGKTGSTAYAGYLATVVAGNNMVGWDTGQGLVQLHSRVTMSSTASRFNAGLLLNYVDANNFLAVAVSPTAVNLIKMDASVQTTVATTARTGTAGEVITFVVQNRAGRILVWLNDVQQISYALTTAERTKYEAGKIHGLYASGASPAANGSEDGGSRWGFLRIAEPGPFSPA
jgi:hypothetical protein